MLTSVKKNRIYRKADNIFIEISGIVLIVMFCSASHVFGQVKNKKDPFYLPIYEWNKASLITPFGIYGSYVLQIKHPDKSVRLSPVYGSGIAYTDSWIYKPKLNLDLYYDVYDVGFHIKDYGTFISLMNRFTPSRDHYFGFLIEAGYSRLDKRPVFGAGLRGNGGGHYTAFLFNMTGGGNKSAEFLDISMGLGLRIPLADNAVTIGGKVYFEGMTANNRVWSGTPVNPTPKPNGDYLFGIDPFIIVALGR